MQGLRRLHWASLVCSRLLNCISLDSHPSARKIGVCWEPWVTRIIWRVLARDDKSVLSCIQMLNRRTYIGSTNRFWS